VAVPGAMSFLRDLSQRRREAEWMDSPGADPAVLADSLRFIRRINAALGYTRATLSHLKRFSASWKHGETIRIIDFATGSGDVPLAICRWANRRGFNVRVVGIDLHETTCRAAGEATRDEPRIRIVRGDALAPSFDAGSFDYAICGMFLHHLSENDSIVVLRAMDRVARRGVIAADLLRDRRAYAWISLFTLFSNPMVRHDGKVSVAQAYNPSEAQALARSAGLRYLHYFRHFGHRFALAGEKEYLSAGWGK
jgi:ubiquinone/menaquinone biosynthesis C-methylase UbiE